MKLAIAGTGALLAVGGTLAVAGAAPLPTPTSTPASTHAPERLNATAYYGSVDVLARQTNGLKAKFTKVDGTPVPGLQVKFTISREKTLLCDATTDTNGYAECKNSPLPIGIPTAKLVLGGYDATFDGNAQYAPVSAHNSVGAG